MRVSAATMFGLAIALCAWGCSNDAPGPKSSYVDQLPPPDEPLVSTGEVGRYGGRFVIAGTTAPQTFNPITATTLYSMEVNDRMFVHLVGYRLDSQQDAPALATRWECADDGTACTFYLRHGALFSDGHPITADDVLFSAGVVLNPSVTARDREMLQLDGRALVFSAPDAYTVVVQSPRPHGSLLAMLDALFILPKHVLQAAVDNGTFDSAYGVNTPPDQLVTSGPWRLKQYVGNDRVVLARNPYWFGVDKAGHRLPYLDELVFLIVPDLDAMDLKFRSGEIDAMGISLVKPANYQWYEQHAAEGHFKVFDLGTELGPRFIQFNLSDPKSARSSGTARREWLRDPLFRQAVSLAIDRDAMIASVLYGEGSKYWSYATPGDKRWALADVSHFDHNPAEARRLLSSIGMVDRNADGMFEDASGRPVTFTLKTTANNESRMAMANFIRDDLAKVGIKVTLVGMEFNALMSNLTDDFNYDAILLGRAVRRPDPSFGAIFYRQTFRRWAPAEASAPETVKAEQLIDRILSEPNPSRRMDAWRELHGIVNEQAWVLWVPAQNLKAPIRDRFANVRPSVVIGGATSIVWNADEFFVKSLGRASSN